VENGHVNLPGPGRDKHSSLFWWSFNSKKSFLSFVAAGSPRIELAMAGGYDNEEPLLYDVFPDDFQWGVATASYQVKFSRVQTSSNFEFAEVSMERKQL
jgi:hypothetical protein